MKLRIKLTALGAIFFAGSIYSFAYSQDNASSNNSTTQTSSEKEKEKEKKDDDDKTKANEIALKEIVVTSTALSSTQQNTATQGISKSYLRLRNQQVNSVSDVVRYDNGITTTQIDRFGASSFNIRGVNENRVAIRVDGISQGQSFSSTGMKKFLIERYSINNNRNSVEIETIGKVKLTKGADSVSSGSGALGGSVNYETKDPRDFLLNNNFYFSSKLGYSSDTDQNLRTSTIAGRLGAIDLLIVKTSRDGKQVNNFAPVRGADDPNDNEKVVKNDNGVSSLLFKAGVNIASQYRVSFTADDYIQDYFAVWDKGLYRNLDYVRRNSRKLKFESLSPTIFYDKLTISSNQQNIINKSSRITFNTAKDAFRLRGVDGIDAMAGIEKNSEFVGFNYVTKRLVNANGSEEFNIYPRKTDTTDYSDYRIIGGPLDENGKLSTEVNTTPFSLSYWNRMDEIRKNDRAAGGLKDVFFEFPYDCNLWDCENITVYKFKFNADGDVESFTATKNAKPVRTYVHNGVTYSVFTNGGDKSEFTLVPSIQDSRTGINEQYLISQSNDQIDLNFEKTIPFPLSFLENNIYYGFERSSGIHSVIKNNLSYYVDPQPWTLTHFPAGETCETLAKKEPFRTLSYLCGERSRDETFMIPVKYKKSSSYVLNESNFFDDTFKISYGLRFDQLDYNPILSKKNSNDLKSVINNVNKLLYEFNKVDISLKPYTNKSKSYVLSSEIKPFDNVTIGGKYSSGFRNPSIDEVYFFYRTGNDSQILLPNFELKPEQAKNLDLSISYKNDYFFAEYVQFNTNYTNFIRHKNIQTIKNVTPPRKQGMFTILGSTKYLYLYQHVNSDKAKITGNEYKLRVALGNLPFSEIDYLRGFEVGYSYSEQKGEADGHPINEINPPSSVFDISYVNQNESFGMNLFVKNVRAKDIRQTTREVYDVATDTTLYRRANNLSKQYSVTDLTAFIRPADYLTVRYGVYNLFNLKYTTWEAIHPQEAFIDLTRRSAPRRNFKASVEFNFTF